MVTNDGGNTGTGGALSDTDTRTITVTSVNDPPTATNLNAAESGSREVLRLWPGNLIALTALSILYYQSGRLQGSLKLVDRILVLDGRANAVRVFQVKEPH